MATPDLPAVLDPLDDEPLAWPPDKRFRAVAALLARGVLRALDDASAGPPLSAGRSSPNPGFSSGSELALPPETSVTVHTG
jgi:hypothetical protein